jgi:hypothetical protein
MVVALLTSEELETLLERAVCRALQLASGSEYISTEEASRIAKRNIKTVRRWIGTRQLRASRRGRSLVILRADLEAFLGGRRDGPAVRELLKSLAK